MSVRVYKVGGPALEDPGLIGLLADEVRRGKGPAVLVHGGGRAVDRLLKALDIESRFIEGRRETSPEAMLLSPPLTLAESAELVLFRPPLTFEKSPPARLPWPPPIADQPPAAELL